MRRKQNIQDTFKSVVPEFAAGYWSVGYSGHTDESLSLAAYGIPEPGTPATAYTYLKITNITNITGTTIMNDVYVYYDMMSGSTVLESHVVSIYDYEPATTTTTTAAATTTTTAAPTTTIAPTTTTTTSHA